MKHSLLVISLVLVSSLCVGLVAPAWATAAPGDPGLIKISEILPNAVNESTGELVEIVNTGTATIDLSGWKFIDASGVQQTLIAYAGSVPFGSAGVLLEPRQVGLILDKDYAGEYNSEILLSDTSQSILLLTTSSGNLSLANSIDSVSIVGPDALASDTFGWTSDPGSEVTFARMARADNELTDLVVASGRSLGWIESEPAALPTPTIVISELLPAPTSGEEFIEIVNAGSETVDLSSVALRDASAKTVVLTGTLAANQYGVFYKSTTGISLNNDGDVVELLWNSPGESEVLDQTSYTSAPADQSWALVGTDFAWTLESTPGEPNVLVAPPSDQPDPTDDPEPDPNDEDTDSQEEDTPTEDPETVSIATLAELATQEEGTQVTLSAIVIAKPGTFYKNTLHVGDASGSALVKVETGVSARVGDVVTVTGSIETYAKQTRLLAEKIRVTSTAEIPYVVVEPGKLSEEHVGRAVRLSGVVTRRSGKSFRVGAPKASDDADTLVSIRKSTGITAPAPKKGSAVSVTGIVLRSGEQLVVAPRSAQDLANGLSTTGALPKSGAEPTTLVLVALLVALVLSAALHGAHPVLRRAGWLGQSKSSQGLAGQ